MIKGLTGSTHVTVSGGNVSLPYIGPNANNPIQGMIRVNMTDFEVFNGTGWQQLPSSYATVGLEPTAEEAIKWVRHKMAEERDLLQRMERHPGLKQAYEQFKIMDILTLEEEKNEQPA
jgi:hypothetical protein